MGRCRGCDVKQRVLIIEDEAPQREVLRLYLENDDLEVWEAADGALGWRLFGEVDPDLVLLDWMLPGLTGEEVCRRIRQVSEVPILVITARVQEENALRAFRLGADDYLRKPFSPREAAARVVRRLTQARSAPVVTSPGLGLSLDLASLTARHHGAVLDLTPQEFDILQVLLGQKDRVFSREQLIHAAWPSGFDGGDRTVDVHIKNLRKKLPERGPGQSPIETVYGRGYRWKER